MKKFLYGVKDIDRGTLVTHGNAVAWDSLDAAIIIRRRCYEKYGWKCKIVKLTIEIHEEIE